VFILYPLENDHFSIELKVPKNTPFYVSNCLEQFFSLLGVKTNFQNFCGIFSSEKDAKGKKKDEKRHSEN
jgi:hypothetical protein